VRNRGLMGVKLVARLLRAGMPQPRSLDPCQALEYCFSDSAICLLVDDIWAQPLFALATSMS